MMSRKHLYPKHFKDNKRRYAVEIQRFLLNYTSAFRDLTGILKVTYKLIEGESVSLTLRIEGVKHHESTVRIEIHDQRDKQEIVYCIQEAVFCWYYEYAYKGGVMKLKDLAVLLGVNVKAAHAKMKKIEEVVAAKFLTRLGYMDEHHERLEKLNGGKYVGHKKLVKHILRELQVQESLFDQEE